VLINPLNHAEPVLGRYLKRKRRVAWEHGAPGCRNVPHGTGDDVFSAAPLAVDVLKRPATAPL